MVDDLLPDATALFKAADSDHSKRVTYAEFLGICIKVRCPTGPLWQAARCSPCLAANPPAIPFESGRPNHCPASAVRRLASPQQ